ncbi:MAG: hypothetical protein AAGJ28_04555 [Pseudomonadota bacterium]
MNTQITQRIPTDADINRAVARGSRLRSQAFRAAFATLFNWLASIGSRKSTFRGTSRLA